MKLAKKLASLLLALVMVLALAVPAFAAAMEGELSGGSITINDAMPGETYKAYQVLYLESYDAEKKVYSYKANSEWLEWLKTDATDYLVFDAQDYVTWKSVDGETQADTDARAAAFAVLLKSNLGDKTPAATAVAPAAAEGKEYSTVNLPADGTTLKLGYYLVDTTTGALCSLDTTNPEAMMMEKNEKPTIDKKVNEGDTPKETNDASIGDTVNFQITVHARKGAENYVVHDKMSEGLTLDKSSIKVEGAVENKDYTVKYPTDSTPLCDNNCTFHVEFTKTYLDTIETDTDIVITYSATLNERAVVAGEGNSNEARLDYGEESRTETSYTKTYTWEGKVYKYTGEGESAKALANAEFTLSKDQDGNDLIKFSKTTGEAGAEIANTYVVDPNGTIEKIITTETGKFKILGLDAGEYYLTETAAPSGYNKLAGPIKVVVSSTQDTTDQTKLTGSVVYHSYDKKESGYAAEGTNVSNTNDEIKVLNNSGTELPSTGGIGTTIFYAVGGVLVLAAVVLLVVKKRMAR